MSYIDGLIQINGKGKQVKKVLKKSAKQKFRQPIGNFLKVEKKAAAKKGERFQ